MKIARDFQITSFTLDPELAFGAIFEPPLREKYAVSEMTDSCLRRNDDQMRKKKRKREALCWQIPA
jgi:hypothetical protein